MEDQKEPDYLAEIVVESDEHPVVPYAAPPVIISGAAELIREAEPIKPDVEVLMNELKKLGEVMAYNYGAVWRVMVKVRKKGAELKVSGDEDHSFTNAVINCCRIAESVMDIRITGL